MAENTPRNSDPAEDSNSRLEQQRKETFAELGKQALHITRQDGAIVESVARIMRSLAEQVEREPKSFFSSGGGDIQALVNALKAKSEGDSVGISGGDIVGGLSWSDIVDTIKALEGFLKDEKQFVMEILRLIFCGCKGDGW